MKEVTLKFKGEKVDLFRLLTYAKNKNIDLMEAVVAGQKVERKEGEDVTKLVEAFEKEEKKPEPKRDDVKLSR